MNDPKRELLIGKHVFDREFSRSNMIRSHFYVSISKLTAKMYRELIKHVAAERHRNAVYTSVLGMGDFV